MSDVVQSNVDEVVTEPTSLSNISSTAKVSELVPVVTKKHTSSSMVSDPDSSDDAAVDYESYNEDDKVYQEKAPKSRSEQKQSNRKVTEKMPRPNSDLQSDSSYNSNPDRDFSDRGDECRVFSESASSYSEDDPVTYRRRKRRRKRRKSNINTKRTKQFDTFEYPRQERRFDSYTPKSSDFMHDQDRRQNVDDNYPNPNNFSQRSPFQPPRSQQQANQQMTSRHLRNRSSNRRHSISSNDNFQSHTIICKPASIQFEGGFVKVPWADSTPDQFNAIMSTAFRVIDYNDKKRISKESCHLVQSIDMDYKGVYDGSTNPMHVIDRWYKYITENPGDNRKFLNLLLLMSNTFGMMHIRRKVNTPSSYTQM